MNLLRKIKDRLIKYRHKRQINFMWNNNKSVQNFQNFDEKNTTSLLWTRLSNNSIIPCYFMRSDGEKYKMLPYTEYDMDFYIKDRQVIINKFMGVKN